MFIIGVSRKARNFCTSCKARSLEWALLPTAFQISLLHLRAPKQFTFSGLIYCLPILDKASLSDLIVNAALTTFAKSEVIVGAVKC